MAEVVGSAGLSFEGNGKCGENWDELIEQKFVDYCRTPACSWGVWGFSSKVEIEILGMTVLRRILLNINDLFRARAERGVLFQR